MAGQARSGAGWQAALVLMLLAAGAAAPATAQAAPAGPSQAPPPAPSLGGRPDFYVPWVPNAPGLTAKPSLKRGAGLPRYPADSIKARESGQTVLEVCITAEGRVTDLKLLESSGFVRLDQALLEWAPTAAYSPAIFNGQPFAVCGYQLVYQWRLGR